MILLRAAALLLLVDALWLLRGPAHRNKAPVDSAMGADGNPAASSGRAPRSRLPSRWRRVAILTIVGVSLWFGASWAWWTALVVALVLSVLALGATVVMSAGGAWGRREQRFLVREATTSLLLEVAVVVLLLLSSTSA